MKFEPKEMHSISLGVSSRVDEFDSYFYLKTSLYRSGDIVSYNLFFTEKGKIRIRILWVRKDHVEYNL